MSEVIQFWVVWITIADWWVLLQNKMGQTKLPFWIWVILWPVLSIFLLGSMGDLLVLRMERWYLLKVDEQCDCWVVGYSQCQSHGRNRSVMRILRG